MEIPKIFKLKNIWSMSVVFVMILSAFLLLPRGAKAANFEAILFRIDTELDVINAKGVTVRWTCAGGSGYGEITDGGGVASDSDGANGLITVASASAENSTANAGCNALESVTATVSLSGWVRRVWTDTITASTSNGITDPFTTRASMDYTIIVNGVDDELGTALQLDGSTASASYSAAIASQSYSNYSGSYKKYIAATATGGTVTAEKDGYVKTTSSAITGFSATASRSVDFGTGDTSNYNEVGLPFAVKVTVGGTTRFGEDVSGIGRTVTAGDSSLIACTDGVNNNYYCAIPLAEATDFTATVVAFGGLNLTRTCIYADRTVEADTQTSCTITATEGVGAGSGSGDSTYVTPTPTPEVTPGITPTPTPTPGLSPTPTPTPVSATLYRKANDPKVYVQGSDGTLSWVKTIEEFNAAGYRWSDVKMISGSEFAQMKVSEGTAPVTAVLFRKANDPKVYVQGSDGTLSWVKTIEAFSAASYNWADVKVISGEEFGKMRVGGSVRVVKGIAFLRVRSGPSTANSVVGQALPNQELKFTEIKNGWYHVNSGWVSGAYAKEF